MPKQIIDCTHTITPSAFTFIGCFPGSDSASFPLDFEPKNGEKLPENGEKLPENGEKQKESMKFSDVRFAQATICDTRAREMPAKIAENAPKIAKNAENSTENAGNSAENAGNSTENAGNQNEALGGYQKCVFRLACDVGTHIDAPAHWFVLFKKTLAWEENNYNNNACCAFVENKLWGVRIVGGSGFAIYLFFFFFFFSVFDCAPISANSATLLSLYSILPLPPSTWYHSNRADPLFRMVPLSIIHRHPPCSCEQFPLFLQRPLFLKKKTLDHVSLQTNHISLHPATATLYLVPFEPR
jgi:hypothetical protein